MAVEVGNKIPVHIAGLEDQAAEAEIVSVDREAGVATIIIPATKVQVGIKVEFDPVPITPPQSGTQVVILGTEDNAPGGTVEAPVIVPAPEAQPITPEPPAPTQSAVEGDKVATSEVPATQE